MIQVLNRAIDILELLSRNIDKEHSLSEIANPLNLNHATCANIIKTLINRGYIEKKKGYILGSQAYYLTNNFSNETDLIKYAAEPMKKLSNLLNESCILAVLKNSSRITLHKETCVHELQANTLDEKHVYHTATGRLLLSYLDPVSRNTFIKTYGLPNNMWQEIKNNRDLIDELLKINKAGYTIHHASSNIVGIAVPIFVKNEVVASLGVYLPENRYNKEAQSKILENLWKVAGSIKEKLSF